MACEWFHVLPQKCHYYDEESTQELQSETANQILTTKILPINHQVLGVSDCDLSFNTAGIQNSSLSPTNVLIIIVQKQLKFEFVELYVPLETDHVV
jgi:hypothetical protein